jgi:glycosyltransferase involved in cell wall biosynthesis
MRSDHFNDVTLLITHYNRSLSLERLLQTCRDLEISFNNIVVSDDGSKQEHIDRLQKAQAEYGFQLISADTNKGLGNNINKGQAAVKTPYLLYIQEDFVPKEGFKLALSDSLSLMNEHQDLDIVRFWSYFTYPYLKSYKFGFAKMIWRPSLWYANHLKFYYYSDHPHLRRNTFVEKFGLFKEGVTGDVTEFSMCMSFLKNKGKGLFYENFPLLFDHDNSAEPSTMDRADWRQSKLLFMVFARWVYLKYKLVKNSLMLMNA